MLITKGLINLSKVVSVVGDVIGGGFEFFNDERMPVRQSGKTRETLLFSRYRIWAQRMTTSKGEVTE